MKQALTRSVLKQAKFWFLRICGNSRIASQFLLLVVTLHSTQVFAISQCSSNGGVGWAIPDLASVAATANFDFGDDVGPIIDATVSVEISHTFVGDIDASISSPDAVSVQLFDRPGEPASLNGCADDDIYATTFDDAAAIGTNIEAVCNVGSPTISGVYQPQNIATNPLADFDTTTANGSWTLTVNDNLAADVGTIDQFCVDVKAASITFDKWVSTNSSCTDTLDNLTVATSTPVYYCYTVTNTGTEEFIVNSGDVTDDQGIDITALEGTYAAGDSVTFSTAAITAGSTELPVGVTTNIATVTATGNTVDFPSTSSLVTTETATVTVQVGTPGTGNIPLYLDAANLVRSVPAAGIPKNNILGNGGLSSWVLNPNLQSPLVVDASGGVVPVTMVLDVIGTGSLKRTFTLDLISSDLSIGTFASVTLSNYTLSGSAPTAELFNLTLTSGTTDFTLPVNSTITLRLTNDSSPDTKAINVSPNNSFVNLPSGTTINVDDITYYDATYNGGNVIRSTEAGNTIYIRATVSEPFGSASINSASIVISHANYVDVINGDAMTEKFDSTLSTKIFEYAYIIPSTVSPIGTWTTTITATDTSSPSVTHTGVAYFEVLLSPSLTVVKSSNVATIAPGGVITYTVQISNGGAGDATNVLVTDDVSQFVQFDLGGGTPFTFIDGGTPSGLSLGTPVYSSDNGTSWLYTPVSGNGGAPAGYDGNVTNWQIPMTGNMNAGGSFSLQYKMRVE